MKRPHDFRCWQALPATELTKLVDRFWCFCTDKDLPQALLPPCVYSQIIFCPEKQPFSYRAGGIESRGMGSHLLFANRLPLQTSQEGMRCRIGIRLMPTAVYHLFGQVNEAKDRWALPLTELNIPAMVIENQCSADKRIRSLNHYCMSLMLTREPDYHVIQAQQGVQGLMNNGCLPEFPGRRTYQRAFHRVLGISPSQFFKRWRASQALTQWKEYPELSGTDLALRLGYYDQSHFINEISRYLDSRLRWYRRDPNLMSDLTGPFPFRH